MALETADQIKQALEVLRNTRSREQSRLERIARFLHDSVTGAVAGVYVPRRATREYRLLVDQSRFNVLDLVVTAVAQNLYVDGFRPTGPGGRAPTSDNAPIWDAVWQPNRMDARQSAIYRDAISYGVSYALVLPGDTAPAAITPLSARRLTALYADPANDEWPELAMEVDHIRTVERRKVMTVRLYDEASVITVESDDQLAPRVLSVEQHDLGVVPIVRFRDRYGMGVSPGKVEPLIPVQQQINQTTFGLAMALQYSAFRQRWATGMEIQEDENGNPIEPFNVAADQMLQSDSPNTKFGTFEQSDLSSYLNARDKQLLHIASVAQIPPHNLLVGAGVSNISAEALAALEAGHRQDIAEHQVSFGESLEQTLRLAGLAMGDRAAWEDMSAQVVWRDTTPRSLGQVADALGKLAQMLGLPVEILWERLPGFTQQDIDRARQLVQERDAISALDRLVNGAPGGQGAGAGREPTLAGTPG
ncbi:MAG: phage portal protein [Micromonosporaceae bacterium]|nr:phage portal protein [Micromonosporaceae bacterium]